MVPPCSHRIPRVRWYSGYCCPLCLFVYRTLTFCGMTSHSFRLKLCDDVCSPNPTDISIVVWPLPLSLATTRGISFDFSSSPYLDVSVREVPYVKLCIHLTFNVFPHSEIHGSKLICSSPWLIAACHVLLRLLMPRHSPYALFRLNFLYSLVLLNCLSFI